MSKEKIVENTVNVMKDITTNVLSGCKNVVMKVAPEIWRSIKLKVIGDTLAMFIFVLVTYISFVLAYVFEYVDSSLWFIIPIPIVGIVFGNCVRKIVASDYMTLIEIINLKDKIIK
jgi:hypothetical protein